MSIAYCPCDIPDWEQIACGTEPKGGINSFAFVCLDHTFTDFTSESEWEAQIAALKAFVIGPGRGEIPDPSAVEGESYDACRNDTELDSFDRTFRFQTAQVSAANIDVVDALNKREGYLVMHTCDGVLRVVSNTHVTFKAWTMTPNNKKQKVVITVEAKWTELPEPEYLDGTALGDIFNS